MRGRICAVLALVALLSACGGPDVDATGREIFNDICARCHAADLSGGVGPALGPGSNAASQDDEYLRTTIRDGRGRMPSFRQTLSTEQIDRVVEYVRSVQEEG
ncbi:MAG TPA: cytochrome c [Acidimicrobiia bacterium]|jgi:mono/diheme cytochrome c family protein|nr:cytochrome c [Acidimicrobiia bacterium]